MPTDRSTQQRRRIGVMFDRARPPEELIAFAREAEALGVDDLWVVEDLGWTGAVSAAALVLGATERLRVGIGIAPAPLRNPALLAMELAMLERVFPGRLIAGIGHGVPDWMAQVGAGVREKLALLGETITAVRALLRGETVCLDGRVVKIDGVRLVHPPADAPPVVAGVVQPRSLELSGQVADGTVIAEGQGPPAIAAALGYIRKGQAGRPVPGVHELVVLTHLCVGDDAERIAELTAPVIEEYMGWLKVPAEDVFLAAGPVATAAERVRSLWDAGADTVVLRPVGEDPGGQLRQVLAGLA